MKLNPAIQEPVIVVESLKTHFRDKTRWDVSNLLDLPIKIGTSIYLNIQRLQQLVDSAYELQRRSRG